MWIRPGHRSGANYNNVSCTLSLKDDEWSEAGRWMWENRHNYNGISVLPYDGGTYKQALFEDCTKEKFEEMVKFLKAIDLTEIIEEDDDIDLSENIACSGGAYEI